MILKDCNHKSLREYRFAKWMFKIKLIKNNESELKLYSYQPVLPLNSLLTQVKKTIRDNSYKIFI